MFDESNVKNTLPFCDTSNRYNFYSIHLQFSEANISNLMDFLNELELTAIEQLCILSEVMFSHQPHCPLHHLIRWIINHKLLTSAYRFE